MMVGKKKFIIFALIVVVAALGVIFYIYTGFDTRARKKNPEKYVTAALQNTKALFNPPKYDSDWLFDILDGEHRLELGLAFKDIDIQNLDVDPAILSVAQLARLDMQVSRDPGAQRSMLSLSLAGGGARLFNADIYAASEEFAISAPQGFDYFITLDPRKAVSEWDNSSLGAVSRMSELATDEGFYSLYKNLFRRISKPKALKLMNDTITLFAGCEYGFISGENSVYDYSLRISADGFNAWYRTLAESIAPNTGALYDFAVTDDIDVVLCVENDIVKSATITTLLLSDVSCELEIELNGDANPFDDVYARIDMKNPGSGFQSAGGRFDIADAVRPYVMIDDMPGTVSIIINHRGDSQSPELLLSEADITMAAGDDRTELAWRFSWDTSAAVLENFKLAADITQYRKGETAGAGFNVSGSVHENKANNEFLSSFDDISAYLNDFDESEQGLGITFKLNLKSEPGAVAGYDKAGAKAISELTPLDLLRIYSQFSKDPVLGGFLGR